MLVYICFEELGPRAHKQRIVLRWVSLAYPVFPTVPDFLQAFGCVTPFAALLQVSCTYHRPQSARCLQILLVEPNDDDLKAIASQLRECNYQGEQIYHVGVPIPPHHLASHKRAFFAVSECTSEADASRMIDSCTEEFDLVICEVRPPSGHMSCAPVLCQPVAPHNPATISYSTKVCLY